MIRSLHAAVKFGAIVVLHVSSFTVVLPRAQALPAMNFREEIQARQDCGSEIISPSDATPACADAAAATTDRAYLVETSTPGYTMTLQGADLAIGRLHPEFVHRLAAAIREARSTGLDAVGIFSAYRPPAFGVGGFSDKFNSLHSYGLAVDMTGIGGPGSPEARSWYEIAARHGVVCPYGVESHLEWNHCQPTWLKIVRSENPLRETITADGPVSLENMFDAGSAVIDSPPQHPLGEDHVARNDSLENSRPELRRGECGTETKSGCGGTAHTVAHRMIIIGPSQISTQVLSQASSQVARTRCPEEARRREKECAGPHASQSAERRTTHAHQAADRGARESRRA
jgi:hypothetical protein